MSLNPTKPSRGRPKTLDRDHVLDVAMEAYWKEGVRSLSLNEICRRCDISKPGLYREFWNEDGLMKAVILKYQEQELDSVLEMLKAEKPFREMLDSLVSFATSVSDSQGIPKGCLLIKMRESRMHLGEATRAQIDFIQEQALTAYRKWVERAKAKCEFSADMSSEFASIYIDAQLSNAASQISRGEDPQIVKKMLLVAFSMF
ncbi:MULTISPECIES: TetR/AcrR family transcriptional regulator [unclassified Pseudomonas]|uniref:TetR/AcrR family transcriptional regulator n=1 Tax=unclassified Pseudomonas TaxID=196821 RepID=UPI0008760C55|nr:MULTISPECIES: TetR/AcrR family transcriptional regulator [unclassified Pseudomonas]SCZ22275.1 transcriptional regulator, TetR family [Pseudomonas sp. NFACC44-2]SDA51544.1 transcriptional regulator, TetR family [Pseudomonas sp. NFACC51]SFH20607.1 transcriptional regulator, TetR family [Pseudomonas sp. NFACC54]SFS96644.1 transcriptional regulator, TetR family [Pseudomonas sp. NFACC48-1]